jgi:hypothetical protein
MKSIFSALLIFSFINISVAGEGMWLPLLLKSLNESEMQQMGMKLTAEDIYSVNQGSLKDAIVHFGGFCTAEIISSQGLLLTNHHCGYGQIQSHSSIDNNLLKNGFWASEISAELANPGLFATLIDEIIDVSDKVLDGVTENMSVSERQSTVDKNINAIRAERKLKPFQNIVIRPFFHGNQYFAFITTTYNDVRLVGTPPESIGKFGADTDNWVWPRHTGDFSLFRIYAGPNNEPAEYSENNKPYQPKHHLPISLDGVAKGDFTMVFGFPGSTQQYLPAVAVEQIVEVLNPAKISIREKALGILDEYMRKDEAIKIQYASKFASVANYWKKWIGESLGIKKTKGIQKKQKLEKEFLKALPKNSPYANILSEFDELYDAQEPYAYVRDYYNEVAGRNIELMRVSGIAQRLVSAYENGGVEGYNSFKSRVVPWLTNFYKNYRPEIDAQVFDALIDMYKENVSQEFIPTFMMSDNPAVTNIDGRSVSLYDTSILADENKMMTLLSKDPEAAITELKADPIYNIGSEWKTLYDDKVARPHSKIKFSIDSLQRIYMKALMETFPNKRFYPDANSTMRVTYGKVDGYAPMDAVRYTPVTYLDGVMEKYKPGDYEFDLPEGLIDLYNKKDYGDYADTNGKLPVCFIGTNHTTGGNSGSPAIDAHGNLIGLNFDRAWEGTMSDYNYDSSICRNIMVDARYILWCVDKLAGAGHLVDEMTLVHPKAGMKK